MGYSMFLSVYFFDITRHLLWEKQSPIREFQCILIYCQLDMFSITDLGIEKQVRQTARQAPKENTSLPVSAELQTPLLLPLLPLAVWHMMLSPIGDQWG